ncbi:nitroreductase family deazaflavin-dependent oxidoreductase [Streptomyces sp. NPDC058475]|uniref:nitroreductase family deazaflavin-dependent oxidoreductase n=1 Tax=Streptomyces sp. NPDC058475 TaxID=3346518 RepID=UPI00365859D4
MAGAAGASASGTPGRGVGGKGPRRVPGVRLVQKVSSTRAFARVAPHLVPALDRAVHRLTRGKVLLSAQMLPGVILTARGAKSGVERRTPLACMPEGVIAEGGMAEGGMADGGMAGGARAEGAMPEGVMADGGDPGSWILIGSNFGRPDHPAWTANLLAHPDVEINWKGEDIPVSARLLQGEERDAAWKAVLAFWPPYATYQARVDREIRLFRIVRR